VGAGRADPAPGRPRQGAAGARRRRRPRTPRLRVRPPAPYLPGGDRQGDLQAAPVDAAVAAARRRRGVRGGRVPHPAGRHAAGERVGHRPRPGRVARAARVQARPLPPRRLARRRRRQRERLRAHPVRRRPEDLRGAQLGPADGDAHDGRAGARAGLAPRRRHDRRQAGHGRGLRAHPAARCAADGPAGAQAAAACLCSRVKTEAFEIGFYTAWSSSIKDTLVDLRAIYIQILVYGIKLCECSMKYSI
jgi:hypothetical protein